MVTIPPPLCIIDIGNGCEAFSTNIYIPAKSELTATFQSVTRSQFFLKYNLKYENLTSFVVFSIIKQYELTEKDKTELCSKVSMLEPMPMELFEQELTHINEDYPYTLPSTGYVFNAHGFNVQYPSHIGCNNSFLPQT